MKVNSFERLMVDAGRGGAGELRLSPRGGARGELRSGIILAAAWAVKRVAPALDDQLDIEGARPYNGC